MYIWCVYHVWTSVSSWCIQSGSVAGSYIHFLLDWTGKCYLYHLSDWTGKRVTCIILVIGQVNLLALSSLLILSPLMSQRQYQVRFALFLMYQSLIPHMSILLKKIICYNFCSIHFYITWSQKSLLRITCVLYASPWEGVNGIRHTKQTNFKLF